MATLEICQFGRKLSDEERSLSDYLQFLQGFARFEMLMKDPKFHEHVRQQGGILTDEHFKAFKVFLGMYEQKISDMFIKAVKNYDGEAILKIAEAIWFLKSKKGFVDETFYDIERAKLFLKKAELDHAGEQWTIRQVAEYLAEGAKVETPADGFRSLRRKCEEINFPLKASKDSKKR